MDDRKKNRVRAAGILMAGVLMSWLIISVKPDPEPGEPRKPLVHNAEVVLLVLGSQAVIVKSQGTVTPKTEIDVTAQVSGQVIEVGKAFAAGGAFSKGERLLTLDPRDYEVAVAKAEADLAETRQLLAREKGQGLQARREWRDLGDDEANDLFLRKPQLAAAQAQVKAADAGLRQAQINLKRTEISLPFKGRVESIAANLGQYMTAGSKIGRVYASDIMEVRLPLTAREIHLLNLQIDTANNSIQPLLVTLHFKIGDQVYQWPGSVVRIESSAEIKSRLFYVVAEVSNISGTKNKQQIPLISGVYVEAEILSNPYEGIAVLPRNALHKSAQLYVLDDENRLRLQRVEILQINAEQLVVRGLESGQRVLVNPPDFVELGAIYRAVPAVVGEAAE